MSRSITENIGEVLVAEGKLTRAQLDSAREAQRRSGRRLTDLLAERNLVSAEELARTVAGQLHIPFLALGEEFRLETEEIKLVPESVARRYVLVPVKKDKEPTILLVMADPLDLEAVDAVQALTNLEVRRAVSTRQRILSVIDRFYRPDAHLEREIRDIADLEGAPEVAGPGLEERDQQGSNDLDQLRGLANDAPVVRFVNLLLMQAVRDRASDIHFEPGEKEDVVRIRVDGLLRPVNSPPKKLYPGIVTRIKILSGMDIAERRLPLDGRFKFSVHGRVIDVRVSSLPEVYGEKLVLRLLDRETLVVDMEEIGFEEEMLVRFREILKLPHGIVLLTGPTGSGKTTTLYSALNYLKSPEKNIQTVEDPVEYLIEGINQMQIRPKIGLDFASALRSILRQDPDIILIGEIRDAETAQIAMRAALTGHLVLSTLHTNDSTSAFCRLRDIGMEPYLTAATVRLVVSQRLVRVICPACRREYRPPPAELALVSGLYRDAADWHYRRGEGCQECGHSGYRGRKAIHEFLEVSDDIRTMIHAGEGELGFRRRALELGMQTLLANGLGKVRRGLTTIEEVLSVCPVQERLDAKGA